MNKAVSLQDAMSSERVVAPPALLFEMIRSFVTLAAKLNLSHAVRELKSTRQTVRRHISTLEEAMGAPLFFVDDRQYFLTETGQNALADAKDILARGTTWLRGQSNTVGCLQHLKAKKGNWELHQEQQPLGKVWSDSSVLLRETFRAWTMSAGQIENELFAHVRPYLLIYRQTESNWICVEFGQKSVYVNWFGQDFARSSIGRPLSQMPAGEEFSHLLYQAYAEVQATETVRLDHVFTRMPYSGDGEPAPVCYQRLIMSGFFPDGSSAVMSLVLPVESVNISGIDPDSLIGLDPVEPLDFCASDARFEPPQPDAE